MPALTRASRRTGFASSTPVTSSGYGTDWTVGPTTDRHYAGYAQDRWSPNDNLTFTIGVRLDYQRVGYGDAVRKPLITDVLADGTRIFPTETNVAADDAGQEHQHRAPARRHLRPDRQGADGAQGVLRPLLQQHRRQLHGANPGGLSRTAEYNFLDQNRNGRYDGPSELGTERLRFGGNVDGRRSGLQDAVRPRRSARRSRPSCRVSRRRA